MKKIEATSGRCAVGASTAMRDPFVSNAFNKIESLGKALVRPFRLMEVKFTDIYPPLMERLGDWKYGNEEYGTLTVLTDESRKPVSFLSTRQGLQGSEFVIVSEDDAPLMESKGFLLVDLTRADARLNYGMTPLDQLQITMEEIPWQGHRFDTKRPQEPFMFLMYFTYFFSPEEAHIVGVIYLPPKGPGSKGTFVFCDEAFQDEIQVYALVSVLKTREKITRGEPADYVYWPNDLPGMAGTVLQRFAGIPQTPGECQNFAFIVAYELLKAGAFDGGVMHPDVAVGVYSSLKELNLGTYNSKLREIGLLGGRRSARRRSARRRSARRRSARRLNRR